MFFPSLAFYPMWDQKLVLKQTKEIEILGYFFFSSFPHGAFMLFVSVGIALMFP